ncbi:hypothetical protein RRSWK_04099 [Rhodopirellula sp. SWK7]|nr:hypothetical protein RRSWK_04099 [Rhodopirellula sp. SWK7]
MVGIRVVHGFSDAPPNKNISIPSDAASLSPKNSSKKRNQFLKMFNRNRTVTIITGCLVLCVLSVPTGCSRDTTARKLDTPEGVDWDAIKAQNESDNAGAAKATE